MALPHAESGERIALRRSEDDIASFTSVALAKTEHMELIRLMLPKGKELPEHAVDGEISLVCLEGELAVHAEARTTVLGPGDMLWLKGRVPHAVLANEDAVGLLTILLPHPG
jgi:quercetin dioxygenase-like cupin family protein